MRLRAAAYDLLVTTEALAWHLAPGAARPLRRTEVAAGSPFVDLFPELPSRNGKPRCVICVTASDRRVATLRAAITPLLEEWDPILVIYGAGSRLEETRAMLQAHLGELLPKVSAKPLQFGDPAPTAPLGSWTLIDQNTLLASPRCASAFPNGEAQFVEDRTAPSRAYLKLWELFTLVDRRPGPVDFCIDLGASPGGWTWVLQRLGAQVLSVDKAPLDPAVSRLPNVEERLESAFALDPRSVGRVDWLFSDVICYPKRLLTLVRKWLDAGTVRRFACTIKFQGETDFEAMREFAAIPGSRLLHLHHNKHELTWVKL
jgi:hypothetical protein